MAYEVVMPYHLHMPSYFLGTFTEYPIVKRGCVKTLAQPHLYFKFCYIFFWLCYFFLMHLATSCYIPIISGYK